MRNLMQDVRYALRQLRRSPSFAAAAVAVLALGLGANIAVFTLIEGILLRPLPYARPERVVTIAGPVTNGFAMNLSYANVRQLGDAVGTTVQMGGVMEEPTVSLVGPGGRLQVDLAQVTAGTIQLLGERPALGREFRSDENEPGREHVVLLSDRVWQKLYNGDKQIVGKTLAIRNQPYTIVGVMPKGFSFPFGDGLQIWSPAPIGAEARTAMNGSHVAFGEFYARLPEGMTAEQLNANLNRVQARIAGETTEYELTKTLTVMGYQRALNEEARKPLGLLYAVVAGIWALACLNVASLMLARAVGRSRERAVRAALGASRWRLLQQSLVESLLLSGMGAALGMAASQVAIKLLWRQIERSLPMTDAIHVDWRVVAGLLLLTLLTAAIVGLVPALRASRRDLQTNLQGVSSTASASHNRTREALVVAQLALTLVFLVGAGLFLRTIQALRQVPLGFREQNVLTGGVNFHQEFRQMLEAEGPDAKPQNMVLTTYLPFLEKIQAMPGVKVAALSSVLPMRSEFQVRVSVTLDHHKVPASETPSADGRLASAGLVEAFGIPMVRGRFFSADTLSSPLVVVINEAFAKRYLPGRDPVGHTVSMGDKGRFREMRIVGVIGDVKQTDVTRPTTPEMYFCLAQMEPGTPLYRIATAFMQVAIRGKVPADSLRAHFDKVLHEVAPDATTTGVKTIHEAVEDSFGSQTLISYLLEGFAGLALLIASVGLYGLLSFAVAQRTREFGLRIALGAPQGNILNLVLRRAMVLVAAGLAGGSVLAWFAVSLAKSYLFGVQAHDAVTFAAVAAILAAAAFVAAWLPARYAASIEPMQALRSE
jgi:predicted permease